MSPNSHAENEMVEDRHAENEMVEDQNDLNQLSVFLHLMVRGNHVLVWNLMN